MGLRRVDAALTGSVVASLAIQGLNAFTGILLARELGADGRGELAVLLLWVGIVAVLGSVGISESTAFHGARAAHDRGAVVGTTIVVWLVQSLVLVSIGAVVIRLTVNRASDEFGGLAYLFLAYVPLWLFAAYGTSLLQGMQAFRSFQAARVLLIATTAALLSGFAAAGGLSPSKAAVSYLVACAVTAIGVSALLVAAGVRSMALDWHLLRSLLGFGARSHTSTVASWLNERLDQFVISLALAPAFLGLYVVAVTLASVTLLVASSVALVALPRIAALEAGPLQTEVALRHARLGIASSAVLVAPFVVFADDLLRTLFGSEFAAVATPSRILLVASAALATTKVLAATLRALGEPLRAGVADTIALGVTACGLAVLLPPYGLTGAAIASLAAYVVSSTLMVKAVAHKLRIRPLDVFVPRGHRSAAAARAVPPGSEA